MKSIEINSTFILAWKKHIEGHVVKRIEYWQAEWSKDDIYSPEGFVIIFDNHYKQYFVGETLSETGNTWTGICDPSGELVADTIIEN